MENGRNWGRLDPVLTEGFLDLRKREQDAVRVALVGIDVWQRKGIPPSLMRVSIDQEHPFDFKNFANVLHKMGIGITDIRNDNESGFITFQPKPYSGMPERKKQEADPYKPFRDFLDNNFPGLKDFIGKFGK